MLAISRLFTHPPRIFLEALLVFNAFPCCREAHWRILGFACLALVCLTSELLQRLATSGHLGKGMTARPYNFRVSHSLTFPDVLPNQ
jgi:hypothetical protein